MKTSIKNYFENLKQDKVEQKQGNLQLNMQLQKHNLWIVCPSLSKPIFKMINESHSRVNTLYLSSNKKIPDSLSNYRKDSVYINAKNDNRLALMLDHTTGNSEKKHLNSINIQQNSIK